ncbi:MAG: prolipoprotein diacylglyceryl transferase [Cyclobacteriaceae bacterium]|nr:prolipoprotein diacylglyceryl transferase [Cyclobacteriaceae bacterium]MDH4295847.1 prolipoprotein diacylglyceryl transferase [Cyclobacteriaceae bacterium]MDH5249595.1 prolipoprotein diacylglyceryl transferase [Cyclobacteriaceae bacterium]
MELLINTNAQYYSLFYMLAFVVSFFLLIAEGRKRKLPQLPWLLVITAGYIFFVFGCRIVTLSPDDWTTLLQNKSLDHATGLVMLGGLLFSIPAIFITKRLMGLKATALDAYAFILPVGMFLQRIGCFLNGCCFGTATNSGAGVQYGREALPFKLQYMEGVIPATAVHSLGLHPVQLYESAGCLMAVVLLWNIQKKFKHSGTLFYLSGLFYYLVRLFTEFFRDQQAHAINTPVWHHLNTIQWAMVTMIMFSGIIIYFNERKPIRVSTQAKSCASLLQCSLYFLCLTIAFLSTSKWLGFSEIAVVYIVIFSTGAFMVAELFKSVTVPNYRMASLGLMGIAFVLMSQTYPEQADSDSTKIAYNTISIGGLLGSQTLTNEDCNSHEDYTHKYRLAAVGFSRTLETAKAESFTFGLNAYTGIHDEYATGTIVSDRPALHSYGFNPFIQVDHRRFAVGTGIHVGDMSHIGKPQQGTSIKRYWLYPQFYMRFGNLNRVFGEISWARNFPSSFPGAYLQASMGFGLNPNKLNSGMVRIGTSSSTGIFLSSSIPAGENFVVEPYLGFLGSIILKQEDIAGYENNKGVLGSISVHYKFNKKNRP